MKNPNNSSVAPKISVVRPGLISKNAAAQKSILESRVNFPKHHPTDAEASAIAPTMLVAAEMITNKGAPFRSRAGLNTKKNGTKRPHTPNRSAIHPVFMALSSAIAAAAYAPRATGGVIVDIHA